MRESHLFSVPSKRSDPLVLRGDCQSPTTTLVSDFTEAKDPKAKIKVLDNIRKNLELFGDDISQLQSLIDDLNAFCSKGRKLHLGIVLEFLVARDEIIEQFEDIELQNMDSLA